MSACHKSRVSHPQLSALCASHMQALLAPEPNIVRPDVAQHNYLTTSLCSLICSRACMPQTWRPRRTWRPQIGPGTKALRRQHTRLRGRAGHLGPQRNTPHPRRASHSAAAVRLIRFHPRRKAAMLALVKEIPHASCCLRLQRAPAVAHAAGLGPDHQRVVVGLREGVQQLKLEAAQQQAPDRLYLPRPTHKDLATSQQRDVPGTKVVNPFLSFHFLSCSNHQQASSTAPQQDVDAVPTSPSANFMHMQGRPPR